MALIDDKAGQYIAGYLKSNLDMLKKAVDLKWDGIGFISGGEGDGKSTLAAQIAFYLDRTFCIDRVVFTADDFMEACINAKPRQAIIFDEAYMSFNARAGATKITRALISMLTMIRKKQLYILIVAPSFFDMTKYIAIHRTRFLVHVKAKGLERGYFNFYGSDKKHILYIKGRKEYLMNVVKYDFWARFTNWSPIDDEEYEAKKDKSFNQFKKDTKSNPEEEVKLRKKHEDEFMLWLRENKCIARGGINKISNDYYKIYASSYCERLQKLNILNSNQID